MRVAHREPPNHAGICHQITALGEVLPSELPDVDPLRASGVPELRRGEQCAGR